MKILLVILVMFFSLNAEEFLKSHSIVNEINNLKLNYKNCQNQLKLVGKLKSRRKNKEEEKYKKLFESQKLKNRALLLEIKKLKIELNKKPKKYQEKVLKSFLPSNKIIKFPASAFRLKSDAKIFIGINGTVYDIWEKRTSFTSNTKKGKWIKITGYFVNQEWQSSNENLWVLESKTIKR